MVEIVIKGKETTVRIHWNKARILKKEFVVLTEDEQKELGNDILRLVEENRRLRRLTRYTDIDCEP